MKQSSFNYSIDKGDVKTGTGGRKGWSRDHSASRWRPGGVRARESNPQRLAGQPSWVVVGGAPAMARPFLAYTVSHPNLFGPYSWRTWDHEQPRFSAAQL